jgi:FAD synthetase
MKKVMIFGTFDVIHGGHIHMFKQAREYGNYLIAIVARDVNVKKTKGIGSVHDEKERLDFVSYIDLIDKVRLGYKIDIYKVIREEKPDVIALGYDQKIYVDNLVEAITKAGLKTEIVKLKEYQSKRLKSSKIKKYIEKML